eukprot:jgi/Mesen1/6889/ME000353S05908
MANAGAKKRKEENERRLKSLLRVVLIANGLYLVLRLGVFYSSFKWQHWLGLLITSAAYSFCYGQISTMAKPFYDESGELIDGGFDIGLGGLCGYYHDIIFLTAFIQVVSILSDKAWYLYLLVPGFAFYKLWVLVLYPYFFAPRPQEEEEDEKSRKKREKAEKKAARPKFSKARR